MAASIFSKEYWQKQKDSLCDFDREKSLREKFGTILTLLLIDYVYTSVVIAILVANLGQDVFEKWTFWGWLSGESVLGDFKEAILRNVGLSVFFSVILAPLWEEFAFRVMWFRKKLRKRDKESFYNQDFVKAQGKMPIWDFVIFTAIIFGLAHGGPINLLLQGVGGLFLAYVYLLNNRSYWSAVIMHAMFNGGLILFSYLGGQNALAAITLPYWAFLFK